MLEQYNEILTIEELCKILKIGRNRRHKSLHLTFNEALDRTRQNRTLEIFFQFALFYYYNGFQTIYCVHQTQEGFHAHYAINTVSFCDGHKYHSNDACLITRKIMRPVLLRPLHKKLPILHRKSPGKNLNFQIRFLFPKDFLILLLATNNDKKAEELCLCLIQITYTSFSVTKFISLFTMLLLLLPL